MLRLFRRIYRWNYGLFCYVMSFIPISPIQWFIQMTIKNKQSGVRIKDFKKGSLLHQVAKVDIVLALKLAKQFGGSKVYFCKLDSIERSVRNRSILKRASTCEGHNRIANDLRLTGNWVRRIIMADLKVFFARPLREIPE